MRRPPHRRVENMNPVGTLSPQQLEQAFQMFNLALSDLCLACEELRQQSLVLTRELALANGELRRASAAAPGAAMDMKSLERAHIVETLLAVNGSRKLAVERLGISERALRYKLQQYRLEGGTA